MAKIGLCPLGIRSRRLIAGCALLLLPRLALADPSLITYSILREGDPMGKEIYRIDRDGDRITVDLTVESNAHILFMDFHYRHHRTEVWKGDRLEKLQAVTDDDGSKFQVDAIADSQGGLSLVSNGKPVTLPADAFPLAMWRKALVSHVLLFAVESDDPPYHVSVKDLGPDSVAIAGKPVATEHYAMTGDVDRDLWYDGDGLLAKVTFRRRGFGISIVRDQ